MPHFSASRIKRIKILLHFTDVHSIMIMQIPFYSTSKFVEAFPSLPVLIMFHSLPVLQYSASLFRVTSYCFIQVFVMIEELSSNKHLTTLRVRVVKVTKSVITAVTSPNRPLTPAPPAPPAPLPLDKKKQNINWKAWK